MLRTAMIYLSTACVLAIPTVASASEIGAEVSASVPEVCRFETAPILVDPSTGVALSSAVESCNSNRSYAITANTRALSQNEAVTLRFGQTPVSLDAGGSTVIKRSRGPSFRVSDLELKAESLDEPLMVILAMVAV